MIAPPNKPRPVGALLAGEPLLQNVDGSYVLSLRQTVFLTFKADARPARAVHRFAHALAEAKHGRKPSRDEKIEMFMAWLQGRIKGEDAWATSALQIAAENLHASAPELMDTLYALAQHKGKTAQ